MALKKLQAEALRYDIDTKIFNEAYLPYLQKIYRYMVFYGSAGSGKSWYVAQMLVLRLTLMDGRNAVVVRKQKTDCLDSCRPMIAKTISYMKLDKIWSWHGDRSEFRNNANGNVIRIDGMDNPENIKSISFDYGDLTDAWYEEASDEADMETMDLIDLRLRAFGQKNCLIVTFNPVNINHWLKTWIENVLPEKGTDYVVLKTTYLDNKFLDPDYRKILENYKRTNPYMYQVYTLGNWGVMGKTVFDPNALHRRATELQETHRMKPPRKCEFSFDFGREKTIMTPTIRLMDVLSDDLLIFEQPIRNRPYVIAMDTSGGGSDFFAAHVIDNVTSKQVARVRSLKDAEDCVYQAYCLGMYYNTALLAVESNFDTYPIRRLVELGYPNLYVRESDMDSVSQTIEQRYGFRTHKGNRKSILNMLYVFAKDNISCINDLDTIYEMQTFVQREKGADIGRWEAAPGCHDDLVMAFAIALAVRHRQSNELVPDFKPLEGNYDDVDLVDLVRSGRATSDDVRRYRRNQPIVFAESVGMGGVGKWSGSAKKSSRRW